MRGMNRSSLGGKAARSRGGRGASGGPAAVRTGIASRISDGEALRGLRLVTMPMGVEEVVTMCGSMFGGDVFEPATHKAVAEVTAGMLDKGTQQRDKFVLSGLLESVGARVRFSSDDYRVSFSARCLKGDVPLVIELVAEQLREPAFHEDDLASFRKRVIGQLRRRSESTSFQAGAKFSGLLYPADHPNYVRPTEEQIEHIEKTTIEELQRFHQQHYGLGSLLVVATGDVDRNVLETRLEAHFSDWQHLQISPPPLAAWQEQEDQAPREDIVSMRDKTSVDLVMGLALGIDREHPEFLPLSMGSYILGGNFSARLMTSVRDEAGLTYGIGSSVSGADDGKDGYWSIHGSFAPQLLSDGRAAVVAQLHKWVEDGVTAEELKVKKATLAGSYQVGLAATSGMAAAMLDLLERGKEIAYMDGYLDELDALTLSGVNGAIGKYILPDRLTTVAAGSIDGTGSPLEAG